MNIVLTIVAVVAVLVAAGLWWWRMNIGRELALMAATATSSVRDIAGRAAGTLVELKGQLRTAAPIIGEFSGKEAVYVRSLVERDVEKIGTDSDGKTKRDRSYETVTNVERHAPAELEDATGRVAIALDGANVEAVQVHQRYEPDAGVGSLVGALLGSSSNTRGHRYTEWIIEAGVPIYVLGSVTSTAAVGADPNGKNPFVVTFKSEEERTKSLRSTRVWLVVAIAFLAILAAAFLYFAVRVGAG